MAFPETGLSFSEAGATDIETVQKVLVRSNLGNPDAFRGTER